MEEKAAIHREHSERKAPGARIRILMLEDNPNDAELIRFELQEAGLLFVSETVETEDAFKEALRSFSPDLILSDYDLPRYSGILALAEARKQCPHVPFILVTGAVTEDRAIEVLTSGARDYVLKNRLNRLGPAVKRALAEAAEYKARQRAEEELREAHRDLEKLVKERTSALQEEIQERKKTESRLEAALSEAQEYRGKLEAALESMTDAVFITDKNGNFIDFNEAFAKFNRFRSKDECWREFNRYPEIFERFLPDGTLLPVEMWPVQRALRGEAVNNEELIVRRKDTGEQWVASYSFAPIRGSHGEIVGSVAVARDVTRKKMEEEVIRRDERRLRRFFESDMVGTIYWNMAGEITDANDKFLRMVGYNREDLKARNLNWNEMTPAEFRSLDEHALEELKKTGVDTPYEKEYIRKDGSRVPIIIGAAMLHESQEGVAFVLDISDRKKAEQELQESEEKYRLIFENSLSGIMITDNDGTVLSVNPAAEQILGGTLEEIRSFGRYGLVDTSDPQFERARVERMRSGRYFGEMTWKKTDGTSFPVEVSTAAFRNRKGQEMLSVIFRDITWRKQAEGELKRRSAQLEDANRELESFSYSVSHDLRAPLRAIEGFSRMLQEKDPSDQDSKHKLQTIRANASKMDRLINDLLSFSRSGWGPVSRNRIDMDRLVAEVWQEQVLNTRHQVELKKEPLPDSFGDEGLIRQVLSNLLANAVKFSRRRKKALIEVGGESKGNETVFYVRDNGAGFDMNYCEKLFGVFQRLHPESEYEGTGVGLAIVQRIIHRHGGKVWAEGKPGKGATFYFSLPQA